jgi:hypothetical protein
MLIQHKSMLNLENINKELRSCYQDPTNNQWHLKFRDLRKTRNIKKINGRNNI